MKLLLSNEDRKKYQKEDAVLRYIGMGYDLNQIARRMSGYHVHKEELVDMLNKVIKDGRITRTNDIHFKIL